MNMVMKLTKELFENVIAYIISEPGAMGAGGYIECLNSNGDTFSVCSLDEATGWEKIKENFEGINGCKFNGPHRNAFYSANVLAIGRNDDIVTTIKEGWRDMLRLRTSFCVQRRVCKWIYRFL